MQTREELKSFIKSEQQRLLGLERELIDSLNYVETDYYVRKVRKIIFSQGSKLQAIIVSIDTANSVDALLKPYPKPFIGGKKQL